MDYYKVNEIEKQNFNEVIFMRITILGFMGTGKSSVGNLLAEKIVYPFYDLDELIVEEKGMSINEIFNMYGEDYFREVEKKALKKIVLEKDDFVLASGGGVVISPINRNFIKKYTLPILLEASVDVICNRLKDDNSRPLLKVENPQREIEKLLLQRNSYYHQFNHRINTNNKDISVIVAEILAIIRKKNKWG